MAVRSQRVLASFLAGDDNRRPSAAQVGTICITLAPKAGVTPSDKPPVRIYLGTESAQFRAERAFVWSIERLRDPARRYDIHLMKDFAGFERRLWLTGFTNYRFAIPELAGRDGRAIYNDADQIYLKDPALLFDTAMGDHGVLSINDRDTSVMLIDCARMAPLWNWDSAKATKNRELEARMRAVDGLWGELDAGWNARDEEYAPATSHLVHYTTIHTQPWRPTPGDYVYRANVASDLWLNIEAEADAAGFQLFHAEDPTPQFADAATVSDERRRQFTPDLEAFRELAQDAEAQSLYYCGFASAATLRTLADQSGLSVERIDTATPLQESGRDPNRDSVDVVAADGLEQLPDLDIPWLLDRLFARATRALVVSVTLGSDRTRLCPADPHWWYAQLAAAGQRFPDRHWHLVVHRKRRRYGAQAAHWSGGALLRVPPTTWVLQHHKTGHRSQALGIADALGWDYETREIPHAPARTLLAALRARLPVGAHGLSDAIRPPWPDLIIASGWLPGLVARWVRDQNQGNTRVILMGRRGGPVGETQDLAIDCPHFGLTPHPQHLQTVLPPSKVGADRMAAAEGRWPDVFGKDATTPRVAWLVGGTSAQHRLDAEHAARMLDEVHSAARTAGGTLAVLTSRRTGEAVTRALAQRGDESVIFEPWRAASDAENPFLGYLAHADILVVTGESESMLAEAVATGKPVYILPLPERAPSVRQRIADWMHTQSQTDRYNARGSRRPQQGLQYLSARLIEQRVFLPRRDMPALHGALEDQGLARVFDGVLETWQPQPWNELELLAGEIRARLAPDVRRG
ncbi:ELM1/GtrOC1 family putative glycosyltransferase [Salinisphaera aquimarina]|uniref:ELM1/GtrOC1 family putative glycosyltransferase n=1 Tax=Salinisphaera aquimarina TaxID=2094031 RepID=A0ABV7ELA1_9GAMM